VGTDGLLEPGDVLRGRYEIRQLLRSAPDKRVYLAHDQELDCQVALDAFSNNAVMPTGLTVSAWETRVLGRLGDHRSIATVQDHWEEGETAFMVTRYLTGGTLRDRITRLRESGQRMAADDILQISLEIATGLEYMHHRHILYRDLQPRNVLFDEWGDLRMVDFDTAVSLDHDGGMTGLPDRAVTDYTAPELTSGQGGDERADLYSLGATMYEMCQGRPPFGGNRAEILALQSSGRPAPIDRSDLPDALRDLVLRLLKPRPDDRPANAAWVVGQLRDLRVDWAARTRGGTPTSRDSNALPEPDPSEVRSSLGARAAEYAVGDFIDGRFEVLQELGRGGFSKVYRVRDDLEDEERALKLFDSAHGYNAVRREVGALRKIRHRNVVEVFWAGRTGDGDWYLITEFIDGEPLGEFVGGTRFLRDREAVDIVLDVLDALVAIHPDSPRLGELDAKRRNGDLSEAELREWTELKDKGLVHRDIKPYNVMLTRKGTKLLDFNIASRAGDPVRTQSGTPRYQPPDPIRTQWDVSADLFATGVMLYELLCNSHPYPNATPMTDEPVIDPRTIRSDLNTDLAEFLIRACAPANADRFSTAAEMQHALREARTSL
jgi:serine/threonine protein kinase